MKKLATILCVSTLLVGCQTVSHQRPYGAPMSGSYYQNQPMAGSYQGAENMASANMPMQQAPTYVQPESAETSQKIGNLMERVRRVERAMLRLDRRMQLIERNELSRMSSDIMGGEGAAEPQGGFQPMSYTGQAPAANMSKPARLPAVQQPYATPRPVNRSAGYQPVAYQDDRITSSLGVAKRSLSTSASKARMKGATAFSGMPSLADKTPKAKDADASSVSIWTIEYETGKVWPGREQLVSSREVVKALAGEKPVAIYARGAKPASKEFRERVRAVSKYLSKVAKLDNVPIASMPARHMEGDTIEIIVTK